MGFDSTSNVTDRGPAVRRSGDMPTLSPPSSFQGRIGVARTDITPPVGIYARSWGAAAHDVAESIHMPLTLTALTMDSGDGPVVLVDVDLGWWRTLNTFHDFRAKILSEFSLPEDRFIFALSHTHAAVTLSESMPDAPGTHLVAPYLESVLAAAIDAVRGALQTAVPATLDWQSGHCGLAATRDLPDPSAETDRFVCGFDPSIPADDTMLVGRACDMQGKLIASLVNYACHPTTLAWDNTSISPDYPGAMRATMEAAHDGAPALFLQGASGELAPRYQYVGDTAVADRHGRHLAHAALATLEDMEPAGTLLTFDGVVESGAPLAVWRHQTYSPSPVLQTVQTSVDLPLKDWPSADELEAQRAACTDRALQERLLRRRDIRRTVGDGTHFALPIHAWRLGDAILIGTLAESYSILQQQLRQRFAGRAIICMNLINGSIGYLPPADLYDTDVYQAWQTPFARGGLEKLIESMTSIIQQLIDS